MTKNTSFFFSCQTSFIHSVFTHWKKKNISPGKTWFFTWFYKFLPLKRIHIFTDEGILKDFPDKPFLHLLCAAASQTNKVTFCSSSIVLPHVLLSYALLDQTWLYPESPFSPGLIRLTDFHQHMQDVKTGRISTFYSINYCLN